MILNILKVANSKVEYNILSTPSVDVTEFTQEIRDLCTDMVDTMFSANGVGLAAPQVGRNLNIFVMRTVEGIQNNTQDYLVIINPSVVIQLGDLSTDIEGCLSLPGILGAVERFSEVECVYQDTTGQRLPGHFTGFQARIYQHEYDHLKGILFINRATKFYRPQHEPAIT